MPIKLLYCSRHISQVMWPNKFGFENINATYGHRTSLYPCTGHMRQSCGCCWGVKHAITPPVKLSLSAPKIHNCLSKQLCNSSLKKTHGRIHTHKQWIILTSHTSTSVVDSTWGMVCACQYSGKKRMKLASISNSEWLLLLFDTCTFKCVSVVF